MKYIIGVLALVIIGSASCKKSNIQEAIETTCGEAVIIDSLLYSSSFSWSANTPSLDSLYIDGDCLHLIVSASGCDGSSWVMRLYDSDKLLYSNPVRRMLHFRFENNEACTAVIQKEFIFSLLPLRNQNINEIELSFPYYYKSITYTY